MSYSPLFASADLSDFSFLPPPLVEQLRAQGIESPTEVQKQALSPVLEGRDLLALSQTGSGKTLAFGLPVALRLWEGESSKIPRALVLAPTRELASQVQKVFSQTLAWFNLRCLTVIGGSSYRQQIDALRQGVDVLVATPGRLLDLVNKNLCDLSAVEFYVLDEVDQMLDIGFADDLNQLREALPGDRQTLFFSATLHKTLERIARQWLEDPFRIEVAPHLSSPKTIHHQYLAVRHGAQVHALTNLFMYHNPTKALIFCETRQDCREVAAALEFRGWNAAPLNSDLSQEAREATMRRFHRDEIRFLVATNVAARGIDVQDLPLVVNFEAPFDSESYTHRTGRTGRAGNFGQAWTLITPKNHQRYWRMMKHLNLKPNQLQMPEKHELLRLLAERELASFSAAAQDEADPEILNMFEGLLGSMSRQEVFLLLRGALQRAVGNTNIAPSEELLATEDELFPRHQNRRRGHRQHRGSFVPHRKGGNRGGGNRGGGGGGKSGGKKNFQRPKRKKGAVSGGKKPQGGNNPPRSRNSRPGK